MKKYIMQHKLNAAAYMFFQIMSGFLGVLATICIQFITEIVTNNETEKIDQIILMILFTTIFSMTVAACNSYSSKQFLNKVMYSIREDLFYSIINRDMTQFHQKNTSYYLSVFNNDLNVVEQNIQYRFYFCLEIAEVCFSLIYAFMQNVIVGLLVVFIGFAASFLPIFTKKLLQKANEEYVGELADHNTVLNTCFSGFEVIKNYQMEKNINKHYEKENFTLKRKKTRIEFIRQNISTEGYWIIEGLKYMIMGIVGYMVMKGKVDISIMVVMGSMMQSVSGSMYGAIGSYAEINASRGVCDKVLKEMKHDKKPKKISERLNFESSISLKEVKFIYPGAEKETLKGINLRFEKNKKYAIIGKSGSGKSTITKLLLHYYNTYSGRIEVDGREFEELGEGSILENIAVIPQEVYIFEDTFRNNITLYGQFSDNEVMIAVEKAGLLPVLKKLENGLDTVMKESGKNISGGERQRISIARAFLYHRRIFIMDEATSSLDNNLAYQIEKTICDMPDITVIMVTHHYNKDILEKCDRIFVIDAGEIAEQGTFDELMQYNGKFKMLYGSEEN